MRQRKPEILSLFVLLILLVQQIQVHSTGETNKLVRKDTRVVGNTDTLDTESIITSRILSSQTTGVPVYLGESSVNSVTLPRDAVPSQLVRRSQSTEVVQLSYQGPAVEEVNAVNAAKQGCPHLANDLHDWHDANFWNVPIAGGGAGAMIEIPANSKVLLSNVSSLLSNETVPYARIKVPGTSQLIINDQNMELFTHGIIVEAGGALVAGSELCRIRSRITITLCGGSRQHAIDTGVFDDRTWKSIEVAGRLDLHSMRYSSTWTRLALPVFPNDTSLVVHEQVNWEPGMQVVVATTQAKDSRDWHENEVRTIKQVTVVRLDEGNVDEDSLVSLVELTQPLTFLHSAGNEYQAEVALLTRRFLIQGDSQSEPVDTSPVQCTDDDFPFGYPCENTYLTGYGGHIIVHGEQAIARMSGLELRKMGQTNRLGRYPMHLHLIGNGTESYVEDCSIWESYYRCISVHGTNSSRISRNVAYDVIGHCYYLEDGVEEFNLFDHNLAALVHTIGKPATSNSQTGPDIPRVAGTLETPVDATASGFYITNAWNKFEGNAAVGGWSGFALIGLPQAIGEFSLSYPWLEPARRANLLFDGNTCHSSAYWWSNAGCIYAGGELRLEDANDPTSLVYNPFRQVGGRATKTHDWGERCAFKNSDAECDAWQTFNNTKVFLSNNGVKHWGAKPEVKGVEVSDFNKYAVNGFGEGYFTNVHITCRSTLSGNVAKQYLLDSGATYEEKTFWKGDLHGFNWYDTGQRHILTNATFRNCGNQTEPVSWAFRMPSQRDDSGPEMMSATRNIRYENVPDSHILVFSEGYMNTSTARMNNMFDVDGSATLRGEPTIIGSSIAGPLWWNYDRKACHFNPYYPMIECPAIGRRSIGSVHMEAFPTIEVDQTYCGSNPSQNLPCPVVGRVNHFGSTEAIDQGNPLTFFGKITGPIGGHGWHISFDGGRVAKKIVFTDVQLPADGQLIVAIPYPASLQVKITVRKSKFCNLCEVELIEAANYTDFLSSSGAKYIRDPDSNNVVFMITPQAEKDVVFQENHPLSPFEREGIQLWPFSSRTWYSWNVEANCSTTTAWYEDNNFCTETVGPMVPRSLGCPQGQQIGSAIDSCENITNNTRNAPTNVTNNAPTNDTTSVPTNVTTSVPTNITTNSPTNITTSTPTNITTSTPTNITTNAPTNVTTSVPTNITTSTPTNITTSTPTNITTNSPTNITTSAPTNITTSAPTNNTTDTPSNISSRTPTHTPTQAPTISAVLVDETNATQLPTSAPSGPILLSSAPKHTSHYFGVAALGSLLLLV